MLTAFVLGLTLGVTAQILVKQWRGGARYRRSRAM